MSHHLSFVLLVDSLTKTYIFTTTHLSNTPLTKYFILLSNLIKEMRKGIVESTLAHSPLCGKQYIHQACPPIDYSFRALLLFKSSVFFFCFKHHWNLQNSRTDFVVLVLVCYKIRQAHFSADPLADEKALGLLGDHSCSLLHFTHHYWSPAESPPWAIF